MNRPGMLRAAMLAVMLLAASSVTAGTKTDAPHPAAPSAAETVGLQVIVIDMSKGQPAVDPALDHLKKYFERSFKKYNTFKYVSTHKMSLPEGSPATQQVRGKELEAQYLGRQDGALRVQVRFDGARMTMKVKDGGLWFHVGRRGKDGAVTVLALKAKTQ